jgi:ABC-type branched-subunit amino acid transport system permease subunit
VLAGLLDLQILIFGISLIVFMIFMPKGITGMIYDLKEKFVRAK